MTELLVKRQSLEKLKLVNKPPRSIRMPRSWRFPGLSESLSNLSYFHRQGNQRPRASLPTDQPASVFYKEGFQGEVPLPDDLYRRPITWYSYTVLFHRHQNITTTMSQTFNLKRLPCLCCLYNFISQSLPCHLCRTGLGDLSLLSYHVDCVRCYEHSLLFFLFSFHYLGLFLSPCYFFLSNISFCLETSFTFFGRLFLPPRSLDTTRQSLTHSPIPLHRWLPCPRISGSLFSLCQLQVQ